MTPVVESQDEVFAFLGDPATYDGQKVKRIDTHAASVFLAGERALKIKRAVRFAFLDYSTLEKRKAACEAELAVNRPFAPLIYLRVVAITRGADGTLALDGEGEPVEWAVEMRRFDDGALLSDLADDGRIDPAPWLAAVPRYIESNDAELRERPELFPPAEVEARTQASRAAWTRVRPLLEQRGRNGLIRRGHGNIVLIDSKPVLFDAIEFSPVIASGDVLYDLAFLLMDLVERGLGTAANIVLNRYLAETRRLDDLDALAALPLFLTLRAAIRAKVTAARLPHAAAADAPGIAQAARAYFALARRLIAPPAPRLVAVGGLSGTGKSVLARRLAPDLGAAPGAVLLRSDVERKAMLGVPETEPLPASGYAPGTTAKVYATLAEKADRVIAAGHSALVDAVFARPDERAAIIKIAAERKVVFTGLFLTAGLDTRLARVAGRTGDASDADAGIARLQDDYDIGPLDGWHVIDASGTPEDTLARAKAELGNR